MIKNINQLIKYHKSKRNISSEIYNESQENQDDAIIFNKIDYCILKKCNLSCKECSTLSPLYKDGSFQEDIFFNDVKAICNKKLFRVKTLQLFGGEPLLIPDINFYIEFLYQNKFFDNLSMITNGLLLPYLSDYSFLEKCSLTISYYPEVNNKNLNIWLEKNKYKYNIRIRRQKKFHSFFKYFRDSEKNTVDTFENCDRKKECLFLYNSFFYPCFICQTCPELMNAESPSDEKFNDKISLNETKNGREFKFLYYKLFKQPFASCYYCLGSKYKKIFYHKQQLYKRIL